MDTDLDSCEKAELTGVEYDLSILKSPPFPNGSMKIHAGIIWLLRFLDAGILLRKYEGYQDLDSLNLGYQLLILSSGVQLKFLKELKCVKVCEN